MAAHRYWRIVLIQSYAGTPLELAALWLLSGTQRVDSAAALTSSRAPDAGALADLQGAAPGPSVRWNDCAGLTLTWDFGAPQEVTDIRLGASASVATFPALARLEYADDGSVWQTYAEFIGITWPGAHQLTRSVTRVLNRPVVYDSSVGWDTAGMTLFGDVGGASVSSSGGALQLAASSGFVRARLDTCPPLADFEAVLTGIGGVRPALVFHQNYWSNTNSSLAWQVYAYYDQIYLNKGTGADTGSTVQTAYANSTASTLCVRVAGAQLAVYEGSAASGTPLLTYTLDAFTNAGQFALGASGGTATFGGLTIRPVYPPGTYIECGSGIPSILPALGRAESSAALPPLSTRPLRPPVPARANYALDARPAYAAANQTGRIRGTVQHKDVPANTPVHRRVRLYRSRDGLLVGMQWSDAATGAYDFQRVEIDQTYTVIADDYVGNWRAVIADSLKPEPMP